MGVYDHDLSTIEGLNRAAGELGEGLLIFNSSYGFPVRYGCLLWQVYLGEYCQVLGQDGPSWEMLPDVQRIGVITTGSFEECDRLIRIRDGRPVPGTWSGSHPMPTKVYVWTTAADQAGLDAFCAQRVPQLQALVLQRWRRHAQREPWEKRWPGWPWAPRPPKPMPAPRPRAAPPQKRPTAPQKPVFRPPEPERIVVALGSGRRVQISPETTCRICGKAIEDEDRVRSGGPGNAGYRHEKCLPPLKVSYRGKTLLLSAGSCCRVCNKPLKGKVKRFEHGYRHLSCSEPPVYTLDHKGRPVYRHGGRRRKDGVWVCPPGSALKSANGRHVVYPKWRSWVPRCPMLDEYNYWNYTPRWFPPMEPHHFRL